MEVRQAIFAVAALSGVVGLGASILPDFVKRVNDAHSEEVGNKPNLLEQWIANAPDFDEQPTFAGFLRKWGPTIEENFRIDGKNLREPTGMK